MTPKTVTKPSEIANMNSMEKKQRVIVIGNTVVMAGIEASLGLDPNCEVVDYALTVDQPGLSGLHPDVVVFELEALRPELLGRLSNELSGLLLIGVDPSSDELLVLSGQRTRAYTTEDLLQVIQRHDPEKVERE